MMIGVFPFDLRTSVVTTCIPGLLPDYKLKQSAARDVQAGLGRRDAAGEVV